MGSTDVQVTRNTLFAHLEYNIRKNITLILDCEERWVNLACVIPFKLPQPHTGLSLNQISLLRTCQRPTYYLLDYWQCYDNPTLDDLIKALVEADQVRAANYLAVDILHESPVSLPRIGPLSPVSIDDVSPAITQNPLNFQNSSPLLNANIQQDLNDFCIQHWLFKDLQSATHNFISKFLIGKGSFGSVYYCKLFDEREVAIKLITDNTNQQFESEIKALSRFKHENLVLLVGYSCNSSQHCLIYEYIKNGNLQDRLQCLHGTDPLSWKVRFLIAQGIAKALSYLHSAKPPCIHRDIKSANILLDKNFVAKVGDFGLSRVNSSNNFTVMTKVACGTSVYMPPEASRGSITVKLDTFAFGVVVLELLTGLPVFDEHRNDRDLLTHIQDSCDQTIMPLIDPKVGDWPEVITNQLFQIAMKCCELKNVHRPLMSEVLPDIEILCNGLEPDL